MCLITACLGFCCSFPCDKIPGQSKSSEVSPQGCLASLFWEGNNQFRAITARVLIELISSSNASQANITCLVATSKEQNCALVGFINVKFLWGHQVFAINMTTLHRLANIGHKSCTGAPRRCSHVTLLLSITGAGGGGGLLLCSQSWLFCTSSSPFRSR